MQDYFLKANSEAELWSKLHDAGGLVQQNTPADSETPEWVSTTNLSIIGVIYTTDPEPQPVPGFHANLRADLTQAQQEVLAPILIARPAQPLRVWA